MPVYFNNVSGISLDHTVEKHVFDVIILMMVHDGFHDFYNDKSKDDFIDLFKKYSVATTVAGGGSTNMEGGSSGVDDIQNLFNVGDRGLGYVPVPDQNEGLENKNPFEYLLDETNTLLNELTLIGNDLFIKRTTVDENYAMLKNEIRKSIKKYIDVVDIFGGDKIENYDTFKEQSKTYFSNTIILDGDYNTLKQYISQTLVFLERIKTYAEGNILSINRDSLEKSTSYEVATTMDESIIISEQLSEKSLALLRRSDLPLQTRFELNRILKEIYDELYSSLKNRININIFDYIFTNTFELLVSSCNYEGCKIDETLNIGKEFIIFEFYKLRSFEYTLSPEEKQLCVNMFNQIDTNRDGNISQVELIHALKSDERIRQVIKIPIPENDDTESITEFTRTFQKIDKDGHEADEGRGISQVEFTNYYSSIKDDNEKIINTLNNDLEILGKYLTPDNFKTKDFEDFYYEELFSDLMKEIDEEYRIENKKRSLETEEGLGLRLTLSPTTPERQSFAPTTPYSPPAIAPDSPGGIPVVEEKSDNPSGKRLRGNPVISGGADPTAITPIILREECVDFFNRINTYLDELNSKTNIDDTYTEFFTDKKPEWWTDGDSSTVSTFDENEYDETVKTKIINLLTFIEGTPTADISNYKGQLESINSIIYIYESFKKFFNNKLYSKVKTKSDNIDLKIPGKSKDLYDELSITYNYNGQDRKIYFSIVEFIYIMYIHYEMDIKKIPHRELKLDIRNSFVINAYTFGENALKRTRPGYETKEQFKVYQALKEKIENFCNDGIGDPFRERSIIESLKGKIFTSSQELFNKFLNNEEALNNFANLISILNKLKKYIERFIPYIDTSVKKKMSVPEKEQWTKIFKCFSEDYVNSIEKTLGFDANDYRSIFGEIIRYGSVSPISSSEMKKGDSLDKEIWKKLGTNPVLTFDQINDSIKRLVNNAMPSQMKKLFKPNYLCNTSILDPMGTFGSCSGVPFRTDYDLNYEIKVDVNNYIKIFLPVKSINDVSIVNGRVEVKVNGDTMVQDSFTISHFNSSEPFSIRNIVNKLMPIVDDTDMAARGNNRNVLFRKFLGDFLQALQVFSNIKNNNNDDNIYYAANDKPASIMLQILIYSDRNSAIFPGRGRTYPYGGINPTDNNGNYGGHIEKDKRGANDVSQYKWKVNYYHPNLDKNIQYFYRPSPPGSPVQNPTPVGGGGAIKKNTRRKNTRRKNTRRKNTRRKNTRRKNTRKNTRRKNTRRKNTRRKNTRRKNTRRKNTRRKNTRRRSKRSRRK